MGDHYDDHLVVGTPGERVAVYLHGHRLLDPSAFPAATRYYGANATDVLNGGATSKRIVGTDRYRLGEARERLLGQRFRDSNHIRRPYRACMSTCERRGLR